MDSTRSPSKHDSFPLGRHVHVCTKRAAGGTTEEVMDSFGDNLTYITKALHATQ